MNARCWLALLCCCLSACSQALDSKPVNVVFVCQYGYGKSLVAALHLERKAAAHGLNVRAVSRGLTPVPAVAPAIVAGLAGDGFAVAQYQPAALTEADLLGADRVIAFSVDVPNHSGVGERIDDIPALSDNYAQGRDRINDMLDRLLSELLQERHLIETD